MVKLPSLKGLFSVLPKYNATYPGGKGRVTVRQPHQTPQSLSITRVKVYGHGYPWLYTQIDKNQNPLYYPKMQDMMRNLSGNKIRNVPGVLLLNSAPSFVIEPKYRRTTGKEFWLRDKTPLGKEVPLGWSIDQYRQAKNIIGKLKSHYDVKQEQVQAFDERPLNEKEKEPFSAMRFVLSRKTPISIKVSGGAAINEKGTVTDVWSDGDPEKDAESLFENKPTRHERLAYPANPNYENSQDEKIVMMKPHEFLTKARSMGSADDLILESGYINKLAERMKRSAELNKEDKLKRFDRAVDTKKNENNYWERPFLTIKNERGRWQAVSHEGRHRAVAAQLVGIEKIPVVLRVQDHPVSKFSKPISSIRQEKIVFWGVPAAKYVKELNAPYTLLGKKKRTDSERLKLEQADKSRFAEGSELASKQKEKADKLFDIYLNDILNKEKEAKYREARAEAKRLEEASRKFEYASQDRRYRENKLEQREDKAIGKTMSGFGEYHGRHIPWYASMKTIADDKAHIDRYREEDARASDLIPDRYKNIASGVQQTFDQPENVHSEPPSDEEVEAVYQELRKPAYWEPSKEQASRQQKAAPWTVAFRTVPIENVKPAFWWAKDKESMKSYLGNLTGASIAQDYRNKLKGFLSPHAAKELDFQGMTSDNRPEYARTGYDGNLFQQPGAFFPALHVRRLSKDNQGKLFVVADSTLSGFESSDEYHLVDGHHRYAAAKLQGLAEVTVREDRLGRVSYLDPYKKFPNEPSIRAPKFLQEEPDASAYDYEASHPELATEEEIKEYGAEPTEEELSFVEEPPDEPPAFPSSSSKMLRIESGDEEAR